MNTSRIDNDKIYKSTILSDTIPSSSSQSTIIGHLINNPIHQSSLLPLSVPDSHCYSSTADEWHLIQPHMSSTTCNTIHQQNQEHLSSKQNNYSHRYYSILEQESFDKVIINVSGLRFETRASTLQRYPDTLLGDRRRRVHYFDSMNNEYFFERHRSSFEAVLYFYQSGGRLTRPENISAEIFLEEIKFFDLGEEVLKRYRKQEGYVEEIPIEKPLNHIQRAIWEVFECPESSNLARFIAIISIVMITISIATFIIETLPSIRKEMHTPSISVRKLNITNQTIRYSTNETTYFWIFFFIETICIIWFCFELICRFIVAPSKFAFIKSGSNIIDVVSIIPYFLQLISLIYQDDDSSVSGFSSTLTVLRIIRLVRVFRIFKLSRHFKGLQVLALTFLASWKELLLLMFFLFIIVIVFSSFMYFIEGDYTSTSTSQLYPNAVLPTISSFSSSSSNHLNDKNHRSTVTTPITTLSTTENTNRFISIPHSFWFAIITMTTVGYGDYVPRTNLGKVIGALCALTGVLTIALPVPIIVSNFTYFYQRQLENTERQYQTNTNKPIHNQNQSYISNKKDCGPEYNEWETTYNESDYSDYLEKTDATTRKLVGNGYLRTFRSTKKIPPIMRYQTLPITSSPYSLPRGIYKANDDKIACRRCGSVAEIQ